MLSLTCWGTVARCASQVNVFCVLYRTIPKSLTFHNVLLRAKPFFFVQQHFLLSTCEFLGILLTYRAGQGRTDGGDTAMNHTQRLRLIRDGSVLRLRRAGGPCGTPWGAPRGAHWRARSGAIEWQHEQHDPSQGRKPNSSKCAAPPRKKPLSRPAPHRCRKTGRVFLHRRPLSVLPPHQGIARAR